jgi:enterochelin esterase-like enzyme
VILDNLIAQGKAKPMLIVMPLGYCVSGYESWRHDPRTPASSDPVHYETFNLCRESLFNEVMPQAERTYRAARNRSSRAIAGFSMCGAESLYLGLKALDRFAWIGAFSTAPWWRIWTRPFLASIPRLIRGFACSGSRAATRSPGIITANRELRGSLASKGIHHIDIETPGGHTAMVWRRNLAAFASLLFQAAHRESAAKSER